MHKLQLCLRHTCLAIGTWKWRAGLPSRRYTFFSYQFIFKTISTSGEEQGKGTLFLRKEYLCRSLWKVVVESDEKKKRFKRGIVILGNKKLASRKMTGRSCLIFYLEVLWTQFWTLPPVIYRGGKTDQSSCSSKLHHIPPSKKTASSLKYRSST